MSLLGIYDLICRRSLRGSRLALARGLAGVVCASWLASAAPASAQNGATEEYQKKASLICNFLRQCRWPEQRFSKPDSPFIVGIYGKDQISDYLRENTRGRLVNGRPVMIRPVMSKEELAMCHLVFVSRSERDRLRTVFAETRRENVLTVGETDNFLASGGVIQFVNLGEHVRYRISLEAARRERIEPGGFVLRMGLPQSFTRPQIERRLAETP